MSRVVLQVLRVVLALALVGSVVVQVVLLPLLWADLERAPQATRVALIVLIGLGTVALQVVGVCLWQLLTLVRRGTVFSSSAFRYVDVIIGAVAAGAVVLFGIGFTLAPGEAVAPGMVALVGGAGVVVAGVALLVYVLRSLLGQAVALDSRAQALQSELDEVI